MNDEWICGERQQCHSLSEERSNAALPDLLPHALTGHGQQIDSMAMAAAPEHQMSSVLRPVSSEVFLKAQHLKHYFCDLCK